MVTKTLKKQENHLPDRFRRGSAENIHQMAPEVKSHKTLEYINATFKRKNTHLSPK